MAEVRSQFVKAGPHGIDDPHSHGPHIELARADLAGIDAEELFDTISPLVQKLLRVDEDQRRLSPGRYDGQGHDSLARPSRSIQNALWALQDGIHGLLLIVPEHTGKAQVDLGQFVALVGPLDARAEQSGQFRPKAARDNKLTPSYAIKL
jgi:hypothetical protein